MVAHEVEARLAHPRHGGGDAELVDQHRDDVAQQHLAIAQLARRPDQLDDGGERPEAEKGDPEGAQPVHGAIVHEAAAPPKRSGPRAPKISQPRRATLAAPLLRQFVAAGLALAAIAAAIALGDRAQRWNEELALASPWRRSPRRSRSATGR